MTPTADSSLLQANYLPKRAGVEWIIRQSGLVVRRGWNTLTDTGLTQIAKGWAGQGSPPLYLVIDSFKGLIQNNPLSIGATSLSLDVAVHKAGDTSLIL